MSEEKKHGNKSSGGFFGGGYGLAFIGALVYYWQLADGFGAWVTGFLKACVWPAFLVHHLLGL
jgi:hypothetical protein